MISYFFQPLLFAAALSLDGFAACFAYGASQVRIPFSSRLILCCTSTVTLIFALLAGKGLCSLLPPLAAPVLRFSLLFSLGLLKIFDSGIKRLIRRQHFSPRNLHFSLLSLQFILTVYADPERVNQDDQSVLSPKEALPLGLALSLDSAAAGIGASSLPLLPAAFLSFFFALFAVTAGTFLGRRLCSHLSLDLSWLCGLLLMGMAFLKF